MGFLDDLKNKAKALAEEHSDKIEQGIDNASDLIDDKTGGQHHDKIETGSAKAKDFVEQLGQADSAGGDPAPT